ncbi:MAG: Uma2 family endonuclease [Limnothrix sp. RL_2_0]|nr:Uma2 family endonuclease [Limnothrix sp. RL_2_0]
MVQSPVKTLTLEEFLILPDTKPASEYINGQIIQKPMPKGAHSLIQTDLAAQINLAVKPKKIARVFTELRCHFAERAIVPDISVFTWERIPRRENGRIADSFPLAPDWIIEILSPGQSQTKVTQKMLNALEHGTEIGWLIDPEAKAVIVYFQEGKIALFTEEGKPLPVPNFIENWHLTAPEIFDWLTV